MVANSGSISGSHAGRHTFCNYITTTSSGVYQNATALHNKIEKSPKVVVNLVGAKFRLASRACKRRGTI